MTTETPSISVLLTYSISDTARRRSLIEAGAPLPVHMERRVTISRELARSLGDSIQLDADGHASLDIRYSRANYARQHQVDDLDATGDTLVRDWLAASR